MHLIFKYIDEENEQQVSVTAVYTGDYLPIVTLADGRQFYVSEDFWHASEAAVRYWKDVMAEEPESLDRLIGQSVLANWSQGKEDGPGDEKINRSFDSWVENTVAKHPDLAFGHFLGSEFPIGMSEDLARRVSFDPSATTMMSYPVPNSLEAGTIPPPRERGMQP